MPRANRHYIPLLYLRRQGSEVDLDRFNRKMEKLIRDCYKTVKTGGHVALLIQNTTELGEDGFFIKAGFALSSASTCP